MHTLKPVMPTTQATAAEVEAVDALLAAIGKAEQHLADYEAAATPTASDVQIKIANVARLRDELARLHAQKRLMRGDSPDYSPALAGKPPPVRAQALTQQEQRILQVLLALGHNPLQLPPMGAKAEGWQQLQITREDKRLFVSKGVFDKAWQRLRDANQIASSPKLDDP